MKNKPGKPPARGHLGVRAQLMLFMSGLTIVTLLLVWALITYWLGPSIPARCAPA